jgi:hypothetical protein
MHRPQTSMRAPAVIGIIGLMLFSMTALTLPSRADEAAAGYAEHDDGASPPSWFRGNARTPG